PELVTKFAGEYGFVNKRLPVVKLAFDGPGHPALYVEPASGKLAALVTDSDRREGLGAGRHALRAGAAHPHAALGAKARAVPRPARAALGAAAGEGIDKSLERAGDRAVVLGREDDELVRLRGVKFGYAAGARFGAASADEESKQGTIGIRKQSATSQ
nr:hypothetical protein [Tanacetum cinerariifolium]